jgi:hypothetical protein
MDNGVEMRHSGFFETVKNDETPYFSTSLKKTLHNQGRIFCDDASKLFDITTGYVGLMVSFPYGIRKGVLEKVRYSDNEYMLWAVNMGQEDIAAPGIGVFLTRNGIEFKVKTSLGNYSVIDDTSTIFSEQFVEMEFFWNLNGISNVDENPTMLIRINNENIIGGITPIADDLDVNTSFYSAIGQTAPSGTSVFENVQFQIFDNVHKMNNIPCSISRIIIENTIPAHFPGS